MKTKITRRRLMASAAAVVGSQSPPAQADLAQADLAQADLAKATREQNRRIGEALAKFEIPLATEPAFQFKA